jgi:hypothetical protein
MDGQTEHALTVVLGAGSSHGCADGQITPPLNPQYRPPLAKDLFAPNFEQILSRFPTVRARADELRTKLAKGKSFEDVFRNVLASAYRNKTFWPYQVPLYLRELLWTVSDDYLQGSSKFDTLVRCVLESKFRRVLFLNLNYDLFLEYALANYDGHEFNNANSYRQTLKRWLYVKPHGSVNWGSILENCPRDGGGVLRPSLLQDPPVLSKDIVPVLWNRHSGDFYTPGGKPPGFLYPRIVVPTDEPKEFICPREQIEEAKRFIKTCDHFLFIGFSAQDEHIIELLREIPDRSLFIIVSAGDAVNIMERLESRIHSFGCNGHTTELHDQGFGTYIESSDFESLVAE